MPLLGGFTRAHKKERGRFEILGFHDATVASFEVLDAKMKNSLPYPVLLDPTGETLRSFGIDEYPTIVLIDPEGKVAAAGNESILPDLLERIEREIAPKK